MKELIDALRSVGSYTPRQETIEALLNAGETRVYKAKKCIVAEGDVVTDFYILKKGIARIAYFDGNQEVTFGFGSTGTLFLSPLGFCMRSPAFFSMIACTAVEMIVVSKQQFKTLCESSHDMALWMLDSSVHQFCACEMKSEMLRGSATESFQSLTNGVIRKRFEDIEKNRPDIVKSVSSKVLASYLGITSAYLSNIRKAIYKSRKSGHGDG